MDLRAENRGEMEKLAQSEPDSQGKTPECEKMKIEFRGWNNRRQEKLPEEVRQRQREGRQFAKTLAEVSRSSKYSRLLQDYPSTLDKNSRKLNATNVV